MKKILVTGGAGFIGYHLIKRLAKSNRITMVDNLTRGRMDKDIIELLDYENIEFINGDLTDPRTYLSLDKDFEYIYHLAAVIGVKNVYENPDRVLYVNSISNLLLFEYACNMPDLKRIFFSSTSEIYAGTLKHFGVDVPTDEEVPLTLDDIKSPRTTYMLSKMYGESICHNYHTKHGIPFTIGRYHNVYGPRMGFLHVIPEMFIKIMNSNIVDCPSPEHTRAMCFVDDAVEMTIKACESDSTCCETLNIGNQDQEIKIKDLVITIAEVLKKDITINYLDETPGSPKRRCPDISKIVNKIAYSPHIALKEGIEKTFVWYEDKLDKRYE
jgi:UDP-glucose 4-epimerase